MKSKCKKDKFSASAKNKIKRNSNENTAYSPKKQKVKDVDIEIEKVKPKVGKLKKRSEMLKNETANRKKSEPQKIEKVELKKTVVNKEKETKQRSMLEKLPKKRKFDHVYSDEEVNEISRDNEILKSSRPLTKKMFTLEKTVPSSSKKMLPVSPRKALGCTKILSPQKLVDSSHAKSLSLPPMKTQPEKNIHLITPCKDQNPDGARPSKVSIKLTFSMYFTKKISIFFSFFLHITYIFFNR